MREEEKFFVVWNVEHGIPRVRHEDYPTAEREAKRLAALNPGASFYILHAVASACRAEPVVVTRLGDGDGIPF